MEFSLYRFCFWCYVIYCNDEFIFINILHVEWNCCLKKYWKFYPINFSIPFFAVHTSNELNPLECSITSYLTLPINLIWLLTRMKVKIHQKLFWCVRKIQITYLNLRVLRSFLLLCGKIWMIWEQTVEANCDWYETFSRIIMKFLKFTEWNGYKHQSVNDKNNNMWAQTSERRQL